MDSFFLSHFFGTSYCQNLDHVQQKQFGKNQLRKTLKKINFKKFHVVISIMEYEDE